ncbi:MAG: hypothetical protein V3T14_09210 [Myxococcota bacterium]
MVGGFNSNVRHRGRAFHVQTEATTRPRPQITTLLFEGGTILDSHRTDFDEQEEGTALRKRMEGQHREMLVALSAGKMDEKLGLGGERTADRGENSEGPRRFGEGVIGPSRLDELVLAQLASG